jgi:hypothetical protein
MATCSVEEFAVNSLKAARKPITSKRLELNKRMVCQRQIFPHSIGFERIVAYCRPMRLRGRNYFCFILP